jgi:hypothetical protein
MDMKSRVRQSNRSEHAQAVRLKLEKTFQPCPAEPGDELYPNGIFELNITRLWAFVAAHVEHFPVEQVEVDDIICQELRPI